MTDVQFRTERSELVYRVLEECNFQDEKWDEQKHPLLDGGQSVTGTRTKYARMEAITKLRNDNLVRQGHLGWESILLEEVFEALSALDEEDAITELIQVAAVAIQAALSVQRNGRQGG